MLTKAGDLFRQGDLAAAIDAANAAVRDAPADSGARVLLAELLLFVGNYERADSVLDAGATIDPSASLVISEFRQLLRGEMARRQVTSEGRMPEFLGQPTATQTHLLKAVVMLRNGDADSAAEAVRAAEEERPVVAGRRDGTEFADFRDADDLSTGNFEILSATGKYFWIPTERVESIEFHPPKRPRDLFWRRCTMMVRDGPDGDVYLPALYQAMHREGGAAQSDSLRLGRATEWTKSEPVCGIGQRIYLAGDEGLPMQQLTLLEFA
ncbi:tetratricopeptide repeat protein [Rhizobium sp. P32RR-XVIII]|uniref:type VI secretion system accessory protein TagJ n=1 Tax=Rhizobium sp. P32RR-XVIII TaxID=2726738 RepID=UPI0014570CD0|nr:type VI secretion system accessory protein TagJ [Rhizobium sp. P32RR-XVIII]NLS07992.1 tetratricopeptide repeat protein [Rhizobium sp. P32RR-XVIII]